MRYTYLDKINLLGNCKTLSNIDIDIARMKQEIDSIPDALWNAEFRSPVHTDTESVFLKGYPPIVNSPEDKNRSVLNSLPYIREFIYTQLPGEPQKYLVAKLKPNGVIALHPDGLHARLEGQERIYDYFRSTIRIHIPIVTNKDVLFYINDRFYHFPEGDVWAINNLHKHGVVNNDNELIRIHVIVDVIPDKEQQDMMRQLSHPAGMQDELAFSKIQK